MLDPSLDELDHHGDREVGPGLLDFAVNVYAAPRPGWLDAALHASLADLDRYPDVAPATEAIAARHARPLDEVLATAGAAEAFTLIARLRRWRRPVVVHPQFTEPHAALVRAGHLVDVVHCPAPDFALDPGAVPAEADLVVVGNPTNPTGVLHPAESIRALLRPGRLVVVDEAFMDAVPGEAKSLAGLADPGLLVVRSLTKHWSIPGLRAGYLLGPPETVAALHDAQVPWSVSTPAIAATVACLSPAAIAESSARAATIGEWRAELQRGLSDLGIEFVPSQASFVLVRLGDGVRARLRAQGIACRRGDTFPGLDDTWARIACRPPQQTAALLDALPATVPAPAHAHAHAPQGVHR